MYHFFMFYVLAASTTLMCMDEPKKNPLASQQNDNNTEKTSREKSNESLPSLITCYEWAMQGRHDHKYGLVLWDHGATNSQIWDATTPLQSKDLRRNS